MKPPALLPVVLALAAGLASPLRAVVIDYVPVGNAGNAADSTGYGAVGYEYQIGKYEVTNSQYVEFLNAVARTDANGLYHTSMGSDAARGGITRSGVSGSYTYTVRPNMGNKPANFVTWYDSARFTNWLHNSQPIGLQTTATTEGGAYTLTGNSGLITKNSSSTVWIPTENEWYKAAYHDPTAGAGGGDHYWLYPTRSDNLPTVATASATGDVSNPGANVVNYSFGADWNGQDGNLTTVGSTLSGSYYGTFDQGGNVWEWNDAIIAPSRGMRGGSFGNNGSTLLATARFNNGPFIEGASQGFRVARVPEPGAARRSSACSPGGCCAAAGGGHARASPAHGAGPATDCQARSGIAEGPAQARLRTTLAVSGQGESPAGRAGDLSCCHISP